MTFNQTVAAALVAGSMALTFVSGASADGPSSTKPAPGTGVPSGTVRFVIDGAPVSAAPAHVDWAFTYEKIDIHYVQTDNEWKYIAIRR
jgi:hypothetical protein